MTFFVKMSCTNIKQLLDEVFVISGLIRVRLADNTYRDLDYLRYYKTESNNCFIRHCFGENNDKHTVARNLN